MNANDLCREIGWLIETTDRDGAPQWFTLEPGTFDDWTKDASKALRFARKEDGDNFANSYLDGREYPCRVTEHLWSGADVKPSTGGEG
jgi:hypothetical protein